jgi:hypothetical protein
VDNTKSTEAAVVERRKARHAWIFSVPRVGRGKGSREVLSQKLQTDTLKTSKVLTHLRDLLYVNIRSEPLCDDYFKVLSIIRDLLEMLLAFKVKIVGRRHTDVQIQEQRLPNVNLQWGNLHGGAMILRQACQPSPWHLICLLKMFIV